MRNKNGILIAVLVLIVVGIAAFAAPKLRSSSTPEATPTPTASATPQVQSRTISIQPVEGKSALDALKAQQQVEVKSYSFGDMVTSINGLAATDTEGWTFYVNGTMAAVGAGDYKPKMDDKLEFRYEKFQ